MFHVLQRPVTTLALVLALGATPSAAQNAPARTLTRAEFTRAKAQQPARVASALNQLRARAAELGLGAGQALVPHHAFTNTQGQTILHLDHTFEGHRVWGSRAIAKVDAEGGLHTLTKGLRTHIDVSDAPALSAEQATRIAAVHLGLTSPQRLRTDAQLVVFPVNHRSAEPILDPATGQPLPRPRRDPRAPFRAFTWAYEVKVSTDPHARGRHTSADYLVDAVSGEILRRDDLQRHLSAPSVPTSATGTGNGYYRGTVSLPTTQMTDGTYALWDMTRGSVDNPSLPYSTQGDGTLWSASGNQVWYSRHDANGSWLYQDYVFQANATNTWGDGLSWPAPEWGNEGGTHGQTAGVDAMYGMTTTWDFYKNVFGRSGLDGGDTTIYAAVLRNSDYDPSYADSGAFDLYNWGLFLGAGSYDASTRPNGQLSQTDLDVIAHEMTHGVVATTVAFEGAYDNEASEEGALDEGTADFFAQMVKAYATRGAGADDTVIPATGTDWTMGTGTNRGTPLRWITKPSKDGQSADGYYDGLLYTNGHYTSGVLSRALYFLSQGASSSSSNDGYSAFLPSGMTGIGNDATARIWFKAFTEDLSGPIGTLTFFDARDAAIQAATDIYGAGAEVNAVMDAFAAVNVGDAHNQATPRTRVWFAPWRNGDFLETYENASWINRQLFPRGETVALHVQVDHAANPSVTWALGGPSLFHGLTPSDLNPLVGGALNADGTWTAPNINGKFLFTATSKADAKQFAEGKAITLILDYDNDTEQDALDLAGLAFSWGQPYALDPAAIPNAFGWVVDDLAVFFASDMIRSAWPVK